MLSGTVSEDRDNGYSTKDDEEPPTEPMGKPSAPVTPKMLIKALKTLRQNSFKGLFFTPREVAYETLKKYPHVEQDFQLLLLEISDKLICAAAAGLIGTKDDLGYYAFDFRQQGLRADSRSELMFWIFYKKMLNKKLEEKRQKEDKKGSSTGDVESKKKKSENMKYSARFKTSKKDGNFILSPTSHYKQIGGRFGNLKKNRYICSR